MKVAAWNEYKIDGTGRLVITQEIEESTITNALDVAEMYARRWNREHTGNDRVNILSCQGWTRAVIAG